MTIKGTTPVAADPVLADPAAVDPAIRSTDDNWSKPVGRLTVGAALDPGLERRRARQGCEDLGDDDEEVCTGRGRGGRP